MASITFLGLTDGQWVAIGTMLLVAVTLAYVVVTGITLRAARRSAIAAEKAADASERAADASGRASEAAVRSAVAAETGLQVATTPVVLWSHLEMKSNAEDRPEVEYRVTNLGPVAAVDVAVAAVRYPVDAEPIETPFRRAAGLLSPQESYPTPQQQLASFVILGNDPEEIRQWLIAAGNQSYGLVSLYSDLAGRRWRAEMRQQTREVSIQQVREGGEPEEVTAEANPLTALRIQLTALEPTPVDHQPGSAKLLRFHVQNLGVDGTFEAKILPGVMNVGEPEYGDFKLQWALETSPEKRIFRDDVATLNVAQMDTHAMTLRFFGPETNYGPQTIYKTLRFDGEIQAVLQIREVNTAASGRWKIFLGIDPDSRRQYLRAEPED